MENDGKIIDSHRNCEIFIDIFKGQIHLSDPGELSQVNIVKGFVDWLVNKGFSFDAGWNSKYGVLSFSSIITEKNHSRIHLIFQKGASATYSWTNDQRGLVNRKLDENVANLDEYYEGIYSQFTRLAKRQQTPAAH